MEIALQERPHELERAPAGPSSERAPPTRATAGRRRSSTSLVVAAGISGALAIALGVTAFAASLGSDGSANTSTTPVSGVRAAIAILSKPGAERVRFDGSGGRMELVVGQLGRAALVLDGLLPAPGGRSYQAWHMVSGESASLAVFEGTEVAVALAGLLPPGATVTVSLEPEGGAEVPTGSVLYAATRRI